MRELIKEMSSLANENTRLGFIGIGNMGSRIARRCGSLTQLSILSEESPPNCGPASSMTSGWWPPYDGRLNNLRLKPESSPQLSLQVKVLFRE